MRSPFAVLFIASALSVATITSAMAQPTNGWSPLATEIPRLPQYCWAQFNPSYHAQGIRTPVDLCGNGMNHLCPGLVQLNRAANATYERHYRKGALGQARIEIDYTLKRIRPDCSIARDAQAADGRIKTLQLLLK